MAFLINRQDQAMMAASPTPTSIYYFDFLKKKIMIEDCNLVQIFLKGQNVANQKTKYLKVKLRIL